MSKGPEIVAAFVSEIRKHGLTVTQSRVSQNCFEIDGHSGAHRVHCVLYVKGRAAPPYRWGVTANVLERLELQPLPWFTVLLYESSNTGYFLTRADVLHYTNGVWPLAADGDYKPAPGTYLARNAPFKSFSTFVALL